MCGARSGKRRLGSDLKEATSEVSFILSAEYDDVVRDLWRLVRKPSEFRSVRLDIPELSRVYRDGHRSYLKGERGLSKWLHPELLARRRRIRRVDKHFEQGRPIRWEDIHDVQPTTGTPVIHVDELQNYPKTRPKPDEVQLALGTHSPLFYPTNEAPPSIGRQSRCHPQRRWTHRSAWLVRRPKLQRSYRGWLTPERVCGSGQRGLSGPLCT